ncbi:NifB/NifX family molybdenum-iron cluster-binding protein [Trichloromonas acetexigens]|uniref:Dinitrogenase iron-molybdenum cofactor biosynthesis protein n=1 Tax=Trichloromonas acetexigens TaxID=38815 RepID=A0A550JFB4_9BACT|nr:NifB/NifX family molybdenum-iron cluster-binding protein [Desulfuromonas acetexigens]TRO81896.1 dinitrogenase iron-molybdenum cofactor biosynthesis protein [Desulfuromonas acetexigens]
MKIVVTTSGNDLQAPLDPRFGRAVGYLLYDTESAAFELIDNAKAQETSHGAGILAAERVARTGAKALITGHCGPKAFRVLQAAGVKVYNCEAATVAEALEQYRAGKLVEAEGADVSGHWA